MEGFYINREFYLDLISARSCVDEKKKKKKKKIRVVSASDGWMIQPWKLVIGSIYLLQAGDGG